MKWQIVFPAWLLLCTLSAFVIAQETKTENTINVKKVSDGVELSCSGKRKIAPTGANEGQDSIQLKYRDEDSGEFACVDTNNAQQEKIYVKFRTCDNCVELDIPSVVGIAVGDVVATIVIGVAVYLFVSQNWIRPATSNKKSSDRQHLVPNEVTSSSSRAPNDHYQPLKHKGGQKDTYDVLANRR